MNRIKVKTTLRRILCAALAACSIGPLYAADRVLVMGISDYQGANSLPGVKFDVVNAQQLAKKLGFNNQATTVLREADLRSGNFMANFQKFTASVGNADRVFVYYSGHGMRIEDSAGDCKAGLVASDAGFVDHDTVTAALSALRTRAKEVIAIFDACHAGGVLTKGVSRSGSPWAAKSAPPPNGKECSTATNYLKRGIGIIKNESILGVAADNYTFIGAATASEAAIDDTNSGGVATNSLLSCLDKGVPTASAGAATVRDLVNCAQTRVNQLIPTIQKADGTGWQRMTLDLVGNTDRPLWQVATTLAPQVSASTPDKFAAQVAALQKLQADSDRRWGLRIGDVPREMPVGENFDIPYTSAQSGYFYVLSASSDGEQFKLLYPPAGQQRYRSTTVGKVGGDPPHGTGGNALLSLDPGGALDNYYLVIVSPTPQSYDHLFRTDADGTRSAKADVVAKFASTTQAALTRQTSTTESAPNSNGISLAGTYGAASFMVRRK